MLTGTPAQLEEKTGLNQASLSVILRMAEKSGQARIKGYDTSNYRGRGRCPAIWEVEETLSLKLA